MRIITSQFKKIKDLPIWSVPLVLLGVLGLAFGSLIPWLGYGYDEWYFIYYSTRGAEGWRAVFNYDGHPQSIWAFELAFRWLGYEPVRWHVLSLLLRWLAVSIFWWVFHLTWPKMRLQTLATALIFAIYPFFTLQMLPISYFEAWLGLLVLGLSFAFSLLAIRYPAQARIFMAMAILFKIGHVFTREYSWFTELLRPALLWFALPGELPWREKLRRVGLAWLPFLLIFGVSVFWRGFLYVPTRETFHVQEGLFSNPLEFLQSWLLYGIQDAVLVLLTAWYSLFSPQYFWLADRLNLALLGAAALVLAGLFALLYKIPSSRQDVRWGIQAMILGLGVVFSGVLPFYIAGYAIYPSETPINARFALGLLPGAALFAAGALEVLFASRRTHLVLLAVLVAFSTSWHLRYTYEARALWAAQSDFFRQFAWRVPGLAPGTVIHVPEPFTPWPDSPARVLVDGDFAYALALNAFYQPNPQGDRLDYWLLREGYNGVRPPGEFSSGHATTTFEAVSGRDLYVYFLPQQGECLRLLQPSDSVYRQYPESIRAAAGSASLAAIDPLQPANLPLLTAILKTDVPKNRWCYYYQKAELARQFGKWDEVISLWEAANAQELRTRHGMELLPFIEALAHTGQFETAFMLTQRANQISKSMPSPLCLLWRNLAQEIPAAQPTFEQVRDLLGCEP